MKSHKQSWTMPLLFFVLGVLVTAGLFLVLGGVSSGHAIQAPVGYEGWYDNSLASATCSSDKDCQGGAWCDTDRHACYRVCRWNAVNYNLDTKHLSGKTNSVGNFCKEGELHFADPSIPTGLRQKDDGNWEYYCCKVRTEFWQMISNIAAE